MSEAQGSALDVYQIHRRVPMANGASIAAVCPVESPEAVIQLGEVLLHVEPSSRAADERYSIIVRNIGATTLASEAVAEFSPYAAFGLGRECAFASVLGLDVDSKVRAHHASVSATRMSVWGPPSTPKRSRTLEITGYRLRLAVLNRGNDGETVLYLPLGAEWGKAQVPVV